MSDITTGRTVDLYTKGGSIGLYETDLVLVPDYGVAISVMTAGPDASVLNVVGEMVVQTLIPALEAAAKEEARKSVAGRYVSGHAGDNSSLVLAMDEGPGVVVERWVSKGMDLLEAVDRYAAATNGGRVSAVRLYPTDVVERTSSGSRVEYRAVFESAQVAVVGHRVFDQRFTEWQRVDQTMYGNVGVDDFVVNFDASGDAVAVEPRVLKVSLEKQE